MRTRVHSSQLQFTRDGRTLVVAEPDAITLVALRGDGRRRLEISGDESRIVMVIVPREFQADLEVDPDSQFGVMGGDYLKGAILGTGYPNYWGACI